MTRPAIPALRLPLLAALAAAVLAGPAIAAPAGVTVSYRDLDLASAAGQTALDARIRRAAAHACGDADVRDLTAVAAMRACRAQALAAAQPQVQVALEAARDRPAFAAAAMAAKPGF